MLEKICLLLSFSPACVASSGQVAADIFIACESLEDEPFEPRNIYWLSFGYVRPH